MKRYFSFLLALITALVLGAAPLPGLVPTAHAELANRVWNVYTEADYTQAIDDVNNGNCDTISLMQDIQLTTYPKRIAKSFTFNGNGHAIDANGTIHGLYFGGTDVTAALNNLTVENGREGVFAQDVGALTVSGCSFLNNDAGVYIPKNSNTPQTITIQGSLFRGNGCGASFYGDGMSDGSADISLTGCRFEDNRNSGVYMFMNNTGGTNCQVTGCAFTGNSDGDGGGLYVNLVRTSACAVTGCLFENNRATGNGGAVYIYNGKAGTVAQVEGCEFYNNQAGGDGGAIYKAGSHGDLVFAGANYFAGNTQPGDGGAYGVYLPGDGSIVGGENRTQGFKPLGGMPTLSPAGGAYTGPVTVAIAYAAATPGTAELYYTLDGSDPSPAATRYTGPVTLTASATLKALAVWQGRPSGIAEATYTITYPPAGPDYTHGLYPMLSGDGAAWPGSGTLNFTSAGPYSGFQWASVDGAVLPASAYTVTEGSTVLALQPEYLATLAPGTHKLTMQFSGGTSEASFTTGAAFIGPPKTGEQAEPWAVLALGALALAGAWGCLARRKAK